jgi:hypothetical protein
VKVVLDENLSPALARALQELFRGDHIVEHIRVKFGPGVTDAEWISALNLEGRWIVVSGDRRITKNKAEYRVFSSSKLIGFFLAPAVKKARVTKQMQVILAHWDRMEVLAQTIAGGAMFELPMTGAIRQLKT